MSTRQVNKYGRANPHGTVTRASENVRRVARKQERPLPMHLQCHPQYLMPTSRNPDCETSEWFGDYAEMYVHFKIADFIGGKGLSKGRWASGGFCVRDEESGKLIGRGDPLYCKAFAEAAKDRGIALECYVYS